MRQIIGYIASLSIIAYGTMILGAAIYHDEKERKTMSTSTVFATGGIALIIADV